MLAQLLHPVGPASAGSRSMHRSCFVASTIALPAEAGPKGLALASSNIRLNQHHFNQLIPSRAFPQHLIAQLRAQ